MFRKMLGCMMAALIMLSALTLTAFYASDAVLTVNPSNKKPIGATLGIVENEVVDIPQDLLESSSGQSSESPVSSSSASSSKPPKSSSSGVVSSIIPSSSSSTVTIPSYVSSEQPSAGTGETLIVKISTEQTVGVYDVNDILPRIVAMEMNDSFADEALRAQTVAAHTYIKYQNNIGKAPVVSVRTPSARIRSLAESVSSQMVYYGGSVINAVYSASTAGYSNSSADVWGGSLPYLVPVESKYDYLDPNWGSTVTYTADQVKSMVQQNAGITLSGDPSAWFQVVTRTGGGYNGEMLVGGQSTFQYNGSTYKILGRYVQSIILKQSGLPTLKSFKFDVTVNGDNLIFKTYGYGHGVGMSQWGAHYYAVQEGWNYQQTLTHYYTGATVH